ncbi:Motility accessory factor [hydrothermal vent metagenome]|uniref:Motility accessory factor n=1 Tax=hydrothermal vent metagenome TaxID=652676 RepID=A0A3B1BPF8_9ZZZZ
MTDSFSSNLRILLERFPNLARTVAEAQDDDVTITPAKSGALSGKTTEVWLSSRYDPVKEAQSFVKGQNIRMGSSVLLYGIGLGYHLRLLLDAIGPNGHLVAAEANPSILKAALKVMGNQTVLEDKRLTMVSGHDENEFLGRWSSAMNTLDHNKTKVVIHTPSLQSLPADFQKVKNAIELIRMERRFPLIMGGAEKENFSRNLKKVLVSRGIARLKGAMAGGMAIIVGAGPSLDRDIIYLALSKKMTVIASDTSLPVLLSAGITPDFVISADPKPDSLSHFELAKSYNLPLIAMPTSNANIIERWTGPLFFGFREPGRFPAPAKEWAQKMGVFESGGSVSCLAMELSIAMGAKAVTLIGQDFGYPAERAYSTGCAPQIIGATLPNDDEVLEGVDYFGRKIKTSVNLYSYRRTFEELVAKSATKTFTLSACGLSLEGVEAIPSLAQLAFKTAKGDFASAFKPAEAEPENHVEEAFRNWITS